MNKKSTLLIILCALILSPFIFAIGDEKGVTSYKQAFQDYTVKAKQSNEPNYVMRPKESLTIKEFIKLAESYGRIQRIEVYYTFWATTEHPPYPGEASFRNEMFYSKSIINCPYPKDLSAIKQELEGLPLIPDSMYIRFPKYRLGFVAQDNIGRELTISFVCDAPVMSVNGKQYRASPHLMASVIDFLPHKSYERINKEIVLFWFYHGMYWYTQKNEQGKKDRQK